MKCGIAILLCITSQVLGVIRDRGDGYSYHKFSGPVSGEIKEVLWSEPSKMNPNGKTRDFVAKPDYDYSYGVRDPKTGNAQDHQESRDGDADHQESRDGDAVSGQYTVLEADGTMRIVKYTADDVNGFKATVEYVRPDGTQRKAE
ncbi:Insect cuticle protein [Popillia japonica]|uniref:Insect cuticle protein n=1 Tax=Popillia japonica TaxID=7064 RepID=A0AAW1MEE2_POPJA